MTLVPQCGVTQMSHTSWQMNQRLWKWRPAAQFRVRCPTQGRLSFALAGIPETGCSFLFLSTGSIVCGEWGLPF